MVYNTEVKTDSPQLDLSIVIPFKDKPELTIPCLQTLQTYGPRVREIILLSNNSSRSNYAIIEKAAKAYANTRLLIHDAPFNFQEINNWAIAKSTGKVVMMLNNDIELVPESKGLLEEMYAQALKPETGAVGCVLLYEDRRTIQHAGVYLVPGQTADALYVGQSYKKILKRIHDHTAPFDITKTMEVNAVTAAAVMIEREKFDEVKGLDESFIICGGDVDICLRLNDKGYRSELIGSDHGYMLHKESKSRSMIAVPYVDFVRSYESYIRHFDINKGDPYMPWKKVKEI